ncbi:Putative amino acid transporter, transmembrane domain-containing protein [Colletotrichum destructivum]|uniref:Amino acid transporter, transmembrane domain-containing protein n=1 Tax=Colletotrichum destructivum TaxID=34406 RepID=A0AAX4I426_9PEZI|nr:Putative amino acid transporter, transmembrane domain-containing protein [Colletotrichum destructivum]
MADYQVTEKKETHRVDSGTEGDDHHKIVNEQPVDVFTNEDGDVNFRGVSWPAAAVLVAKFQLGLGVLSLPKTFHTLGFFPGILCFVILSIMTTASGYVSGNARLYYPQIYSVADVAEMMFGKKTREFVGFLFFLYLALTAGAGMLASSVALNALSGHGACTMAFVGVAAAVAFLIGGGFRSLDKIAWVSWAGFGCIFVAIWTTAIACLVQDRPAAGPATGPVDLDIRVFPVTTFAHAMSAVSNQLFAVGASGVCFSIAAEMKEPKDFGKALLWGQGIVIATCVAIASIVYAQVGQYLASPALGSAGPLIKKVAYGIGLPGLLVTAILYSHTAGKYWFVRILRGTRHLQTGTVKHWIVWGTSMLGTVVFGFIIVGVVPFFSDFLSLVGSLVNPVFTHIIPGFMVLYFVAKKPTMVGEGGSNVPQNSFAEKHWIKEAHDAAKISKRDAIVVALSWAMIVIGAFIIVGGTYATVLTIKEGYDNGSIGSVFSCADNSSG